MSNIITVLSPNPLDFERDEVTRDFSKFVAAFGVRFYENFNFNVIVNMKLDGQFRFYNTVVFIDCEVEDIQCFGNVILINSFAKIIEAPHLYIGSFSHVLNSFNCNRVSMLLCSEVYTYKLNHLPMVRFPKR
ncbi:MAG: hypothetical protein K1060chlam5_00845 [Candidatus Anoxychlamydiales bacterium]|nr:hypothetical protein [Candidatus Anoxychlamydiales bacterium]